MVWFSLDFNVISIQSLDKIYQYGLIQLRYFYRVQKYSTLSSFFKNLLGYHHSWTKIQKRALFAS